MSNPKKLFICFVAILTTCLAQNLPTLNVSRCPNVPPNPSEDWGKYRFNNITHFKLDDGSSTLPIQRTSVQACYNDHYLFVKYLCDDNNVYNPYLKCNDPLYEYDVVEMFIAPKVNVPVHHYVEIELSPNDALFVSGIQNPNLTCAGIQGSPIGCASSGIVWQANREDEKNFWWGYLQVPWSLVDQFGMPSKNQSKRGSVYVGNFFRIDTPRNGNKEYSCWSMLRLTINLDGQDKKDWEDLCVSLSQQQKRKVTNKEALKYLLAQNSNPQTRKYEHSLSTHPSNHMAFYDEQNPKTQQRTRQEIRETIKEQLFEQVDDYNKKEDKLKEEHKEKIQSTDSKELTTNSLPEFISDLIESFEREYSRGIMKTVISSYKQGEVIKQIRKEVVDEIEEWWSPERCSVFRLLAGVSDKEYKDCKRYLKNQKSNSDGKVPAFLKPLGKVNEFTKEFLQGVDIRQGDGVFEAASISTTTYLKKQLTEEKYRKTMDLLKYKKFDNNTQREYRYIRVIFSGDGILVARGTPKVQFSLSILNKGKLILSPMHTNVIRVWSGTEDADMESQIIEMVNELTKLEEEGLDIEFEGVKEHYKFEFFYTGDQKFISVLLGLSGATHTNGCNCCDSDLKFENINESAPLRNLQTLIERGTKYIDDTQSWNNVLRLMDHLPDDIKRWESSSTKFKFATVVQQAMKTKYDKSNDEQSCLQIIFEITTLDMNADLEPMAIELVTKYGFPLEKWDDKNAGKYVAKRPRAKRFEIRLRSQGDIKPDSKDSKGSRNLPLLRVDLKRIIADPFHIQLRMVLELWTETIRLVKNTPYWDRFEQKIKSLSLDSLLNTSQVIGRDCKRILESSESFLESIDPAFPDFELLHNSWVNYKQLNEWLLMFDAPEAVITDFPVVAKVFVANFCTLTKRTKLTPTMHMLIAHVPQWMKDFKGMGKFSCQCTEHNNKELKGAFRSHSNKNGGYSHQSASNNAQLLNSLQFKRKIDEKHGQDYTPVKRPKVTELTPSTVNHEHTEFYLDYETSLLAEHKLAKEIRSSVRTPK